jgi:uncharacterized protein (TIGR02284 family)
MSDRTTISALNQLIEICRGRRDGLLERGAAYEDEGLKWMFQESARTRGQFAEDLKEQIRQLGGAVEEGGSVAGAAHRGWMDMKGVVKGHSDRAILTEAARGEDRAVRAYKSALQTALPPSTESIVKSQYMEVKDPHDRLRALEEQWRQRT